MAAAHQIVSTNPEEAITSSLVISGKVIRLDAQEMRQS
jgi:hypothetical protein